MGNPIKIKRLPYIILIVSMSLCGCMSITLNERQKSSSDPSDEGSKTEFNIKGPIAAIEHTF